MAADYTVADNTFRAEKPMLWSETRFIPRQPTPAVRVFDLHPDGEHVAIAGSVEDPTAARRDRVVFVFNFFDELRRVAAPTK